MANTADLEGPYRTYVETVLLPLLQANSTAKGAVSGGRAFAGRRSGPESLSVTSQ